MKLPSLLKKSENPKKRSTAQQVKDASVENYYASLPESMLISAKLGFAYVINEPLSEVGGDGLWIYEKGGITYFAVFDCMGHGRMATIMTRLYIESLEEIVATTNTITPAQIITGLHEKIKKQFEFKQGHFLGTGADIGVLRIDKKKKKFKYAGAKMDLITVNKGVVTRHKANKRSIGGHFDLERNYEDYEFSTKNLEDAKHYLYSDGVTDLFGGLKGKKLGYRGFELILEKLKRLDILKEGDWMKKELKVWEGNHERLDDLLLVGFKIVV